MNDRRFFISYLRSFIDPAIVVFSQEIINQLTAIIH
jgi:hypothetical protein